MTSLDKEHFCSATITSDLGRCPWSYKHSCEICYNYHRKWPTPEQFEEEYGRKAEGMPFYILSDATSVHRWVFGEVGYRGDYLKSRVCVIACTPYGCPPSDWRPE